MARTQLIIEMDESELARLSETARHHHAQLDQITVTELVQLWFEGSPHASKAATTHAAVGTQPSKPSREMRRAAIASVHGMWRNDPSKKQDGLEYQREIRAES